MTTWKDVNAIDPSLHGPSCSGCGHPRVVHFGECSMNGCACKVWIAETGIVKADEPGSITLAREIVREYDERGICPTVASTKHVCVWTCPECQATMPPTHARHVEGGAKYPLRCALRRT